MFLFFFPFDLITLLQTKRIPRIKSKSVVDSDDDIEISGPPVSDDRHTTNGSNNDLVRCSSVLFPPSSLLTY